MLTHTQMMGLRGYIRSIREISFFYEFQNLSYISNNLIEYDISINDTNFTVLHSMIDRWEYYQLGLTERVRSLSRVYKI